MKRCRHWGRQKSMKQKLAFIVFKKQTITACFQCIKNAPNVLFFEGGLEHQCLGHFAADVFQTKFHSVPGNSEFEQHLFSGPGKLKNTIHKAHITIV